MKAWMVAFCLFPILGFSLLEKPWFGDVYEFHLFSTFAYSRFNKVQGASPQIQDPYNNYLVDFNLDLTTNPQWCYDVDLQFVDTPKQSFSFRSTAVQGRYLWYDDIVGDAISLVTGINARYVATRSLRDVGCSYHATLNVEANIAIGKEVDRRGDWLFRFWGFGAAGIANRGSPWVRGIVAIEGNFDNQQQWTVFGRGEHTYGRKTTIDPNQFNGYGKIRQKSIDVGVGYGYCFGPWGSLKAEYTRRVLAKLCPENVNLFTFRYFLPFAF